MCYWGICDTCLGWEVAARLELLEEGRHEDGGEKEDHTPEEDIWDVGAMGATSAANKLPLQLLTLLLTHSDDDDDDKVNIDKEHSNVTDDLGKIW